MHNRLLVLSLFGSFVQFLRTLTVESTFVIAHGKSYLINGWHEEPCQEILHICCCNINCAGYMPPYISCEIMNIYILVTGAGTYFSTSTTKNSSNHDLSTDCYYSMCSSSHNSCNILSQLQGRTPPPCSPGVGNHLHTVMSCAAVTGTTRPSRCVPRVSSPVTRTWQSWVWWLIHWLRWSYIVKNETRIIMAPYILPPPNCYLGLDVGR